MNPGRQQHPEWPRLAAVVGLALLAVVLWRAFAVGEEVALAAMESRQGDDMAPGAAAGLIAATAAPSLAVAALDDVRTSAAVGTAAIDLTTPEVNACIEALRDDGIVGNGIAAFDTLCDLPAGPVAALDAALQSGDEQQRTFAGGILRCRCEQHRTAPSDDLLAVSVQGLHSQTRVAVSGTRAFPLAATSLRFLVEHSEAARPPLRRALDSGDEQQRFLAAFALAAGRDVEFASRIARELVQRLGDNQVSGDALMASHGLYRLGKASLPSVREWRGYVDEQARGLLHLVELDVQSPPRDKKALRARAEHQQVTTVYHDPVIEFDLTRSVVPRW